MKPSRLFRHRRRARRTLLWAAGIFVLVQLAGSVLLDYAWPAVRWPSLGQVLDRLEQEGKPPEVICLGSSRFMHGVPDHVLTEALRESGIERPPAVLNAAVPAGDQVSSAYLLRQLLRRGVEPRLAIIEVTPESLNAANSWFFVHVQRQLRWEDLPRFLGDICKSGHLRTLVKSRLLPLYVHRRQVCRGACDWVRDLIAPNRATIGSDLLPNHDAAVAAIIRKHQPPAECTALDCTMHGARSVHRWLKHYRIGGSAASSFEQVVARCRDHGMNVLLVAVPVTKPHRLAYTPEIDQAFLRYVQEVAGRQGCEFVDYRDRLPDHLFMDNHHMLPVGADEFCRLLARSIVEHGKLDSRELARRNE